MRTVFSLVLIAGLVYFYFKKKPAGVTTGSNSASGSVGSSDTNIDIGRIGADITIVESNDFVLPDFSPFGIPGAYDGEYRSIDNPVGGRVGLYDHIVYQWNARTLKWTYVRQYRDGFSRMI